MSLSENEKKMMNAKDFRDGVPPPDMPNEEPIELKRELLYM